MNSKITLPRLASLLAQRSGKSKKNSEDFIKAFFSTIADSLQAGESVRVKGLGLFKLVKVDERRSVNVATGASTVIPAHDKLTFIPAKELAETVNAPFSIFDTVELSDAYDPEADSTEIIEGNIVDSQDSIKEEPAESDYGMETPQQPGELPQEELAPAEPKQPESVGETTISLEDLQQEELEECQELFYSAEAEAEESAEPEPEPEPGPEPDPELEEESTPQPEDPKFLKPYLATDVPIEPIRPLKSRRSFSKGFLIGFGCALLLALIACGLGWYYFLRDAQQAVTVAQTQTKVPSPAVDPDKMVPTAPSDSTDSITAATAQSELDNQGQNSAEGPCPKEAEAAKEKPVVYDKVTTSRYLTTIAREHYGNVQFWPYIYEENKAILGHPDRIRPGTRVVVPDLKKYGVDPRSKADEHKARNKGAAIYARYRR